MHALANIPGFYLQNYSNSNQSTPAHTANSANMSIHQIGKQAPFWVPDNMTVFCMQCSQKFSFIKRRHHCRACGLVLCSSCCSLKARLEYLGDVEARICVQCDILLKDSNRVSISSHYRSIFHLMLGTCFHFRSLSDSECGRATKRGISRCGCSFCDKFAIR